MNVPALHITRGVSSLIDTVAFPVVNRRRETELIERRTEAEKRIHAFQESMRNDTEWQTYENRWENESSLIFSEIGDEIRDGTVKAAFSDWWEQRNEKARQTLFGYARERETDHNVRVMAEALDTAEEIGGEDGFAIATDALSAAYRGGWITESRFGELTQVMQDRIILGDSRKAAQEIFNTEGYGAATAFTSGLNKAEHREKLTVEVERWFAQRERIKSQQQLETHNSFYDMFVTDRLDFSTIDNNQVLDYNQKFYWRNLLQNHIDNFGPNGPSGNGPASDISNAFLSDIYRRLDAGENPFSVLSDVEDAFGNGRINRTEYNSVRSYKPIPELNPVRDYLDKTAREAGLSWQETHELQQKLLRVVQDRQYVIFDGETIVLNSAAAWDIDEIRSIADNLLAQHQGQRVLQHLDTRDARRGSRSLMDTISDIQKGHYRGIFADSQESLYQLSQAIEQNINEQPRYTDVQLSSVSEVDPDFPPYDPETGAPRWVASHPTHYEIDADTGQPVQRTPVLVQAFAENPVTGEKHDQPTLYWYYDDGKVNRWVLFPAPETPVYAGPPRNVSPAPNRFNLRAGEGVGYDNPALTPYRDLEKRAHERTVNEME